MMEAMRAMQREIAGLKEENRVLKEQKDFPAAEDEPKDEAQMIHVPTNMPARCFPSRRERGMMGSSMYAAVQIAQIDAEARARAMEVSS